MTDKDFGRKPKFGPVSKRVPSPPPKNWSSAGRIEFHSTRPVQFGTNARCLTSNW